MALELPSNDMKQRIHFTKFIQFWGVIFVIGIVITMMIVDLFDDYRHFKQGSEQLRTNYIASQKQIIKTEVERVVELISYERKQSEILVRKTIKKRVYEAYSIAQHIYSQNKSEKSSDEIKQMIIDALQAIRFSEGRGYFFGGDFDGHRLFHPDYNTRSMSNSRSAQGQNMIHDMIEIVKNSGEGFQKYQMRKKGREGTNFEKIFFVIRFEPYDWFIGAGLYVDDIEEEIEAGLLSTISRIHFGKEGYLFVNKLNGDALVSNGNFFSGKEKLWEVFDKNPEEMKAVFEKEYAAAIKPEGDFIYYSHVKLTTPGTASPKTSFVYGIPEMQWLVGAGVYLDDVENDIALMQTELGKKVRTRILFVSIVAFVVIALFLQFFRVVSRRLGKDIQLFSTVFHNAANSNELIDQNLIQFEELNDMAENANIMLTARRQSEEEIREKERFQEQLLNGMLTFVAVLDPEGSVLFMNNTPLKVSGITLKDVIGKKFYDGLWWAHSDDARDMIISDIEECASGIAIVHDIQIQKADRSLMWVEFSMHPIFDDSGKVQYLIPEGRDITPRKQLAKQLQQAQKMESIGTLAGGIAHDFNNILSAILGYSEMAQKQMPKGSLVYEDLGQVLVAGNRAKDLVAQILAFSRHSQEDAIALIPQPVVKEVVKLLRSSIPSTITIKQHIDENCGLIKVVPTQLHQVLMNLCTNAFQAMEEQGGVLDISLEKVELTKQDLASNGLMVPGSYVRLSVLDSGSGIDPLVQEKIFDPYFTTKGIGDGTGMGLAMVHGIVKSHGGMIRLESRLGEGTVFHVFFPELQSDFVETAKKIESHLTGDERILFVDDEALLTTMVKRLLSPMGYSVTAVNSSLEAFELYKSEPEAFDLLITDQTMPEMTGVELSAAILTIRPSMPIILCTGYSSTISREKALSLGIREFLTKPVGSEDICSCIREIFDRATVSGS